MKFDDYVNGILKEETQNFYDTSKGREYLRKKYGQNLENMPKLADLQKQNQRLTNRRKNMVKMLQTHQNTVKDPTAKPGKITRAGQEIDRLKDEIKAQDYKQGQLMQDITNHPSYARVLQGKGFAIAKPADVDRPGKDVVPSVKSEPKTVADVGKVPVGTQPTTPLKPQTAPETQTADLSKYALPAAAAVGGLYVGKKALDWATGKKKKKKKNNEV